MRIGIIGSGHIGGTLGMLLTQAGHEVSMASRSEAGSVEAAVRNGEVVIFAGYFAGWPDFAAELSGKVVMDAANPYPARDGAIAEEVAESGRGSACFVADLLPRSHVAKVFNTLQWEVLRDRARAEPRTAMAVAADERAADVAGRIVRDAGFEPVVIPLSYSGDLDPGAPVYARLLDAAEMRRVLGVPA